MRRLRSIRTFAAALATLGGTVLAGTMALPAPASAAVSVGIGIGVPGPGYYGTYRIRTGLCSRPRFAFNHPNRCGYPRFSEPVFIDGAWVNEPLYYRTYGGNRYFWRGGRWVVGHGSWDGRVFRGDWRRTWHDRGWDRREDMRENVRDRMQDRMEDRRDNMRDRMEDRRDNRRDRTQDRREDRRDRDNDRDKDNDRGH